MESENLEKTTDKPKMLLIDRLNLLRSLPNFPTGKDACVVLLSALNADDFDQTKNNLATDDLLFLYDVRNATVQYLFSEINQSIDIIKNKFFGPDTKDSLEAAKKALEYLEKIEGHRLLDNKEIRMVEDKREEIKNLSGEL